MKKYILLLLLIPFLSITCKEEDEPIYDSEFGSIYVTVKQSNDLIPEAIVLTNPETNFFQTDFSGSVIVKDIEPQTYQILAYHPDFGTGTGAAIVKSGEVTALEIDLIPGVFENPIVNFVSPENGSELDVDTPIEFSVIVSDNDDSPPSINLEWSSNLDGLLSTQSAGSNGVASITVDNLSEGDHIIQVKAKDSDGFIGGAIVNINISDIPNSVFLNPLQGLSTGIQLNWTTSDESSFSNYKIYRSLNNTSNFDQIETIDNVNTTSYFDNDVSIGENYYYQVGVNLSNGEERLSNTQFIPYEGVSIYVGTQVERMVVDPERPFLYALDRVNNSLLFIDTDQGILAKTIFVGSSPTDLDLSIDGEKLYIANFGSTQINVIDLTTQEIDFSFFVDPDVGTWDGNPYRIAALSGNRLAFTSEDQWNSVKIVDATTGNNLAVGSSIYRPELYTNIDGTVLYAAESGSSGSQVLRYNVTSNSLSEVDESGSGSAQRGSFITANGEFIFFRKQKILASNLQSSLGTFPDNIYAANKNGTIALGEEQYYSGSNYSILGNLPVASKIIAADPNDDIFYIYNTTSSSIIVFTP